jgi:hypothetical protein
LVDSYLFRGRSEQTGHPDVPKEDKKLCRHLAVGRDYNSTTISGELPTTAKSVEKEHAAQSAAHSE